MSLRPEDRALLQRIRNTSFAQAVAQANGTDKQKAETTKVANEAIDQSQYAPTHS